ncbi:MAG: hypothetical protein E7341_05005 [Clostridiales bacterium]|nr:hypothetical protein [Clostridiales bacterium]
MTFLLSSTRDFVCGVSECLSWIFVLINFLSIFYLAFCMFYKINKVVKMIGYVWSCVVTAASVVIIAVHTCLFTVVCAAFTGLMLFGLLYVILKNKKVIIAVKEPEIEEPQNNEKIEEEIEQKIEEILVEEPAPEVENYDEVQEKNEAGAQEEIVEESVQEEVEPEVVPETYIFDDKLGKVVEPEKGEAVSQPNIIAKEVEEQKPEVQEVKEPVVEEIIVPVHNKFTDIVVSQIEGMPEMEETAEKSREELVRELENRPVMVRFQQVNFNTNGDEKKTRVKRQEKTEPVIEEKPKVNRGVRIQTFVNDDEE